MPLEEPKPPHTHPTSLVWPFTGRVEAALTLVGVCGFLIFMSLLFWGSLSSDLGPLERFTIWRYGSQKFTQEAWHEADESGRARMLSDLFHNNKLMGQSTESGSVPRILDMTRLWS